MEQEVYGDLLFCVNFSMDFLCFYLTAKLLHRRLPLANGFCVRNRRGICGCGTADPYIRRSGADL